MQDINNTNGAAYLGRQNRIFFTLKKSSLVQKVLIDTLLTRNNCLIDDLASLLHIDPKKLYQVWQGEGKLTEKKSVNLINLFYMLSN